MTSFMFSIVPPFKAISTAGPVNPAGRNEEQNHFIELYNRWGDVINAMPEAKGLVSSSEEEIENFFQTNGIEISMPPITPSDVYLAGIGSFYGMWANPGKIARINASRGIVVEGTLLEKGVGFYTLPDGSVVAKVSAIAANSSKEAEKILRKGAEVFGNILYHCYFTVPFQAPTNEYELFETTNRLSEEVHNRGTKCEDFEGLGLPTVEIKRQHNMHWLSGLQTDFGTIASAVESNALEINKNGVRATSGFVGNMMIGIEWTEKEKKDPYVIRDSYIFWIEKETQEEEKIIVFSAYVSNEDFKIAEEKNKIKINCKEHKGIAKKQQAKPTCFLFFVRRQISLRTNK